MAQISVKHRHVYRICQKNDGTYILNPLHCHGFYCNGLHTVVTKSLIRSLQWWRTAINGSSLYILFLISSHFLSGNLFFSFFNQRIWNFTEHYELALRCGLNQSFFCSLFRQKVMIFFVTSFFDIFCKVINSSSTTT